MVLHNLSSFMGESQPAILVLHHNDRVRVYGIGMSIPEYRDIFECLAAGTSKRRQLVDDPMYHLKEIYITGSLLFNNGDFVVNLPTDVFDIIAIESIDANDTKMIRINRYCECIENTNNCAY